MIYISLLILGYAAGSLIMAAKNYNEIKQVRISLDRAFWGDAA